MKRIGFIVCALLSLTGCKSIPVREYCATAKPIITHCVPDGDGCATHREGFDYLTKPTADQILAHDRTWKALCK